MIQRLFMAVILIINVVSLMTVWQYAATIPAAVFVIGSTSAFIGSFMSLFKLVLLLSEAPPSCK